MIHQRGLDRFFRALCQFADSTGDGGILIDDYSLTIWTVYNPSGRHISRIFPIIHTFDERIIKTSSHSLFKRDQPASVLPPHLDALQWIKSTTGFSQERIGKLIGVTRQAMEAWKKGGTITDDKRQRIFAVKDVLERAAVRYPTRDLLTAWLDTPRGADGSTPAQLLANNEINRARLLAVSSPSPHLVRAPSLVKQPAPEAFRAGAEHRQEALPHHADDESNALIEEDHETYEDGEVFHVDG